MAELSGAERGSLVFSNHPGDMQKPPLAVFHPHIPCLAALSISPLLCPSLSPAVSSCSSGRDKSPTISALIATILLPFLENQLHGGCVHTSWMMFSYTTNPLNSRFLLQRVRGAQEAWTPTSSSISDSPSSLLKQRELC